MPHAVIRRLVAPQTADTGDQAAKVFKAGRFPAIRAWNPAEGAESARLYEHVAQRGRFDRACDDRHAGQGGGSPAQEGVLGSAANDVDDSYRLVGEFR